MALAGNSLLLTYFVGQGERSASLIQALGVASNFTLLVQAGCSPSCAICMCCTLPLCAGPLPSC